MSPKDSLVLVVAGMVEGEVEKATNKSYGLIGACAACMVEGEVKKRHQQVITTRWCQLWPLWLRERPGPGVKGGSRG